MMAKAKEMVQQLWIGAVQQFIVLNTSYEHAAVLDYLADSVSLAGKER